MEPRGTCSLGCCRGIGRTRSSLRSHKILLSLVCAGARGESGWCSDQTSALGTCTHAWVQPLAKVAGGRNRTPRVLHTPWPKPRPGTSLVRSGRLVLPGVASPPPFRPAVRFSPPLLSRPCNPSRCFSLAGRPAREPRLGPQFQSHGSLVVSPPTESLFPTGPCSRRTNVLRPTGRSQIPNGPPQGLQCKAKVAGNDLTRLATRMHSLTTASCPSFTPQARNAWLPLPRP